VKHLQIAEGLRFPLSAVEDVVAILGRRGRGKTTTAAVIVEELHAAGARFCVADPTGVWWGLKSSRDGKRAGIPVIVMGGEPGGHGDVPLAAESGSVIADFVAEPDSPSCVIDLHHFSQADLVRFMTAFLSRLYQKNTHPLHLVLDEADQFAPQRPMPGETAMLGAAQRVTKMGRVKGLHPILITQRPATLSKNVLTQAGTLIAHAITGPQDRNAVDEWVKANAGEGERATFLATLPTLPRGTAYVWNPDLPLFQRVAIRDRQTFDSSSTPTGNAERAQPKTLAEVDLRALEARIADTIERAKADDPRELRKRVAELERQLAAKPAAAPPEKIEVPVLEDKTIRRLAAAARVLGMRSGAAMKHAEKAHEAAEIVRSVHAEIQTALGRLNNRQIVVAHHFPNAKPETKRALAELGRAAVAHIQSSHPARPGPSSDAVGRGGLQRMLVALAQRPQGLSAHQLGVRAGLSSKSGTFDTYLARARKASWIAGDRGQLTITDAGLEALGSYEPLPTGVALLDHWLRQLGNGGASRMLHALANAYPRPLTREALGEAAGLTGNSGTFDTYLGRLRALELVSGKRELHASAEFFE